MTSSQQEKLSFLNRMIYERHLTIKNYLGMCLYMRRCINKVTELEYAIQLMVLLRQDQRKLANLRKQLQMDLLERELILLIAK